ncbi:MAG: serine hydrolase domain-containing protein [Thermomicrobiales bacterium]
MTQTEKALTRLDQFVRQRMQVDNTPGLTLAITDRERTLHAATYGYADLAAKTPVTPDTLFEIGSIGKSFTGIALVQLAEAGQIDVHAPVSRYLSWFDIPSEFEPITPHHLLSHTAGITAGMDATPEAMYQVWALRELRAACPPGSAFHYSNLGFKALGLVLEAVVGQGYGDIIQERLLEPLGMVSSIPAITHDDRARLAVGYQSLYDDRPPQRHDPLVPSPWIETDTGDGSIAATAGDMAVYLRLLLNRGQGPRGPILDEAGFARFTQRAIEIPGSAGSRFYGYGIYTSLVDGHTWHLHGGGMIGYLAMDYADLDDGIGVIAMINGPGSPVAIARAALELFQAAIHDRPLPSPAVEDPRETEGAAGYAGVFSTGDTTIELVADGPRLELRYGGDGIVLEPYGDDSFTVNHPAFARFLLRFERNDDGRVVAVAHGGDWYASEREPASTAPDYPPAWDAYAGHYRAHNPWAPTFRVIPRRGRLWLDFPLEPDGFDDEQPLISLADGTFQSGEGPCQPERIRFDTIVDGRALRATLSGADYYRVEAVRR